MKIIEAEYHAAILPEHQGNPLIEALPVKINDNELMTHFCYYPDPSYDISEHPDPFVREEYLARLKELRQPLSEYLVVARAIERAIKNGYSAKNPFSPTTQQYLHYSIENLPKIAPKTGYFEPKSECITLIGVSGTGKTSMLEQVLNYYPNVIEHPELKDKKFPFYRQVVWLKVECPHNSSVKELCHAILNELDIGMGLETKPARTIGDLQRQIEQRIKTSFLGILVIDEMQRLKFSRTGGENNLLSFLHFIVNKLGVPLFFCANPPFDDTLAKTLKAARRAESGGYFEMNLLERDSDSWNRFIEQLWDYQWTNKHTELTKELNDKIYSLSAGNLDIAHRTYRETQRVLIGSADEKITEASLEVGYIIANPLTSRTNEIIEAKNKLILPQGPSRSSNNTKQQAKVTKTKHKPDKTADPTKIQHAEFEEKLITLMSTTELSDFMGDMDIIQRSIDCSDQAEFLRKHDLLLDDPLTYLD